LNNTTKTLVIAALLPFNVHALPILMTGGTPGVNGVWDVTTVTGSGYELQSTLEAQVWWGDEELARLFVQSIAADLGFPNGLESRGAAFATSLTTGYWWRVETVEGVRAYNDPNPITSFTYAIAERGAHGALTVPEPGTLALFGAGLFVVFLRRRDL
jgi:hypothetical protein